LQRRPARSRAKPAQKSPWKWSIWQSCVVGRSSETTCPKWKTLLIIY
jgi:hypothetical protein